MLYNTSTYLFLISFYMKRFLPAIIIAVLLVGIGVVATKYDLVNLWSSVLWTSTTPKAGDTVSVNYVLKLTDGTIEESSNGSPISFVIDSGSMIKWFNDAVKWMKKGETKTVTLLPADAYGDQYKEEVVSFADYKEVITQKVPSNVLTGIISQDLPKAQAEQILGGATEGTEKKLGEATIKVTKVSGDTVTVSINDPQAPFYGETLKQGLEAVAQDGSKVIIKSISGDEVEVDIIPDQKIIKDGKELTKEEAAAFLATNPEKITLKVRNASKYAGKSLVFEITLEDIKPVTTTAQ